MTVVAYNPPMSRAVVDLPKESVERFEAAGWTPVKQSKPAERKPAAKK